MAAFVSLFRGINVGGNHPVKMEALKALHEALGLRDVRTYIQSGNVVFSSDDTNPAQLQRHIEVSFEEQFGFRSAVMLRTSSELQAIIENNPFLGQPGKESKWVVVMFLAAIPEAGAQEMLRKAYGGPEEIFVVGQEVYIFYPEGIGRSKLTGSYLENKLKTQGTARNWNTVLQLREMMQRV